MRAFPSLRTLAKESVIFDRLKTNGRSLFDVTDPLPIPFSRERVAIPLQTLMRRVQMDNPPVTAHVPMRILTAGSPGLPR